MVEHGQASEELLQSGITDDGIAALMRPGADVERIRFCVNCNALWLAAGGQVLELPEHLAAALGATEVSSRTLVEFKWPWPAFIVNVNALGVGYVLVAVVEPEINTASEEPVLCILVAGLDGKVEACSGSVDGIVRTVHGKPALTVGLRIAVGACLMMTDEKERTAAIRRACSKVHRDPGSRYLPVTRYRLTSPVSVDLRDAVEAYVRYGGGHPKVRTIVCGHHKLQPHGPNHSWRKHIWVKPYVRGAEYDIQLIRTHVIKHDTPNE